MIDGKLIILEDVQRLFLTVNVEIEEQDFNPDTMCQRFEFIELLIRIADRKYKLSKMVNTISEAFELLLKEFLIPYHRKEIDQKINGFRR